MSVNINRHCSKYANIHTKVIKGDSKTVTKERRAMLEPNEWRRLACYYVAVNRKVPCRARKRSKATHNESETAQNLYGNYLIEVFEWKLFRNNFAWLRPAARLTQSVVCVRVCVWLELSQDSSNRDVSEFFRGLCILPDGRHSTTEALLHANKTKEFMRVRVKQNAMRMGNSPSRMFANVCISRNVGTCFNASVSCVYINMVVNRTNRMICLNKIHTVTCAVGPNKRNAQFCLKATISTFFCLLRMEHKVWSYWNFVYRRMITMKCESAIDDDIRCQKHTHISQMCILFSWHTSHVLKQN